MIDDHDLERRSFTTDQHRSDIRQSHVYYVCTKCGERREREDEFRRLDCE